MTSRRDNKRAADATADELVELIKPVFALAWTLRSGRHAPSAAQISFYFFLDEAFFFAFFAAAFLFFLLPIR
jgi:hypothetical protein